MATYTVTETGRTWAAQKYNRTTRRWVDGGAERDVEIRADDGGVPVTALSDDELLAAADVLHTDDEIADPGAIADEIAEEIERRLTVIGDEIDNWDGESARWLANRLNDLESLATRAGEALEYVPGRPHGYDFSGVDRWCDVTSLGWHGEREPSATREDVYACDKADVYVVLVAGTTDDGWTTEEPEEGE